MMKKFKLKAFKPVSQEEKDLIESIEREERKSVMDFNREKDKAIEAARNTLEER